MPFPLWSTQNKRGVKLCISIVGWRKQKKKEFWIKLWPVIELLLLLAVRRLFNSFDLLEKCQKGPREEDTRLSLAKNTHRTGCTVWYLLFEYEPNINANDTMAGRENSLCISLLISMLLCLKKKKCLSGNLPTHSVLLQGWWDVDTRITYGDIRICKQKEDGDKNKATVEQRFPAADCNSSYSIFSALLFQKQLALAVLDSSFVMRMWD